MKYNDFLLYLEEIKKNNNNLIDLSENDIYKYFDEPDEMVDESEPISRSHMLEDYFGYFKLPDNLKQVTGVSTGVRDSLKILFQELDNWVLPQDVYPFYQNTINKPYETYQTMIDDFEDGIFNNIPNGTLLINYPLKPVGRYLSKTEFKNIRKYLKQSSDNLVVIDMVYLTDKYYHNEILELYKSGRVILLHSLSKMFLLPDRFGVCILPEKLKHLKEKFMTLPKNNVKLLEAKKRLYRADIYNNIRYNVIMNNLILHRKGLRDTHYLTDVTGYLMYDKTKTPEQYLNEGYIVVPESVYGGTGSCSVISSLINDPRLTL